MTDQFPVVAQPEVLRAALGIPEPRKPAWDRLRCDCNAPYLSDEDIPAEARLCFNAAMADWITGDAHGFWQEPEAKDGHSDPQQFVYAIGSRISELHDAYNGQMTQSPIEDRLLGAMLWIEQDWAGFPKFMDFHQPATYRAPDPEPGVDFFLTPQAKFGTYRADFCLWFVCGRSKGGVVIECDGHDFHEKTKEQAARDKKRDREILKAGFPVMRFSGSEIFKDTPSCISQIKDVLADILYRVSKEGGLF